MDGAFADLPLWVREVLARRSRHRVYALLWLVARQLPLSTRFALAVLLEATWEVFENTPFVIERYRAATISLHYYGDSIINSMSDIAAMMLGFWLARRLTVWATT